MELYCSLVSAGLWGELSLCKQCVPDPLSPPLRKLGNEAKWLCVLKSILTMTPPPLPPSPQIELNARALFIAGYLTLTTRNVIVVVLKCIALSLIP